MTRSIKLRVYRGLLFIMGSIDSAEFPIENGDKRLWSTDSCIVVGCQLDDDGETEILLGPAQEIDPGIRPAFAGVLDTPDHRVVVMAGLFEELIETNVSSSRTTVKIWINHPEWPDRVLIGLS